MSCWFGTPRMQGLTIANLYGRWLEQGLSLLPG